MCGAHILFDHVSLGEREKRSKYGAEQIAFYCFKLVPSSLPERVRNCEKRKKSVANKAPFTIKSG